MNQFLAISKHTPTRNFSRLHVRYRINTYILNITTIQDTVPPHKSSACRRCQAARRAPPPLTRVLHYTKNKARSWLIPGRNDRAINALMDQSCCIPEVVVSRCTQEHDGCYGCGRVRFLWIVWGLDWNVFLWGFEFELSIEFSCSK